jgi:hypothetical protein
MVRFRMPVAVLFAIAALLFGSLRYLRSASASPMPLSDEAYAAPILVELFTSEGCSSCPPADALLEKLDRDQPVNGPQLIVLSEHVDYWDDIGWRDPYSSHELSERQSAYAAQFGQGSVYTPQMVVDGRYEFVGSDERRATQAIRDAAKAMKSAVSISFSLRDEKTITLHIEAGPLPPSGTARSANVFLAIADNSDKSQVGGGENAGRTLTHVAVLRNLNRIGAVDTTAGFSRDMKIDLDARNQRNARIVVIVQEASAGRVWGAGLTRVSN